MLIAPIQSRTSTQRNLNNYQTNNLSFKNNFKTIDLKTWDRINLFKTYQNWQDPYSYVNVRMNITNLLNYCKKNNIKASHAIIYLVTKNLNDIPQYRTRLLANGSIVEYEKINPVFSVSVGQGKPFSAASVEYDKNPDICLSRITNKIEEIKKTDGGDFPEKYFTDQDNFHMSCVKDIDFSSMKCGLVDPKDSKPLVSWGKYSPEESLTFVNKILTPITSMKSTFFLRSYHGFADGDHVATFLGTLQKNFDAPEEIFGKNHN